MCIYGRNEEQTEQANSQKQIVGPVGFEPTTTDYELASADVPIVLLALPSAVFLASRSSGVS